MMNQNIGDSLQINKKNNQRPYLIGIAGGSGGGKTSVAKKIYEALGQNNCLLFSMDTYYKDLTKEQMDNIANYNFDEPDALDLNLLFEHLHDLMEWKEIDMPTYDFTTSKRQKETIRIKPNKCIIFEGILSFHDKRIRDLMNLKIFVDLDGDLRLARRIFRDMTERGRAMSTIIQRYHEFVKPAYNKFIAPTKRFADVLITKGAENTISLQLLSSFLKEEINILFPTIVKNEEDLELEFQRKNSNIDAAIIDQNLVFLNPRNNLICPTNQEKKDKILHFIKNSLNFKRKKFALFYIESLCDIILEMIPKEFIKNSILFSQSDLIEKNINIIKDSKKPLNVLLFYPFLIEEKEEINSLIKSIDLINNVDNIIILSLFFNENLFDSLFNLSQKVKNIVAIFSGKKTDGLQLEFKRIKENIFKYETPLERDIYEFSQESLERSMILEYDIYCKK